MSASQAPLPRKPKALLARRIWRRSTLQSGAFIGYALVLYLVPLAGIAALLAAPSVLRWLLALPLVALSGYGLYLMAIVAHEGFHFCLSDNKMRSCALGCLVSAILPLFCATGFFVYHWQHHRHNNTLRDPDYRHFIAYEGLVGKVLLSRLVITARYALQTVRLAAGADTGPWHLPLERRQMQALARFNLLCQAVFLSGYAWLFLHFSDAMPVLLPVFLCTTLIASMNAFQEHAFPAGPVEPFARSRTSPLLTLLHAGSNFHIEHHLYPGIPCWRLGTVHAALRSAGWYDARADLLDAGTLGTFKYCLPAYAYGGTSFTTITQGKAHDL